MKVKITDVSWHRNGVGGVGFYAVTFTDEENRNMVASLFDEPGYCAVYEIELLSKGDIVFGSNSWRGDVYESALRPAVEGFVKKDGSGRIGPFALPVLGNPRKPRTA